VSSRSERRVELAARIRIDADRAKKHGGMALRCHDLTEFGPIVLGTTGGGCVDVPEQSNDVPGSKAFEQVVGTGEVGLALDGHPLPPGPKDHRRTWPSPEIGELPHRASRHKGDDWLTGDGMGDDARVDH
jgi:hypothetical protein